MMPSQPPHRDPSSFGAVRRRTDAFLCAAAVLAFLDIGWSVAVGAVSPPGFVLTLGLQLAAGLAAACITAIVAVGLSRLHVPGRFPRAETLLYHAAPASLLLVGAASLFPARAAALVVLAALGAALSLAWREFRRRSRPRSTLPYALGGIASSGLFWIACDALQIIDRMGSTGLDVWLLLFVGASVGAYGFAFLIGVLFSDRDHPLPPFLAVACAASGLSLAILPTALFQKQYPTVHSITYVQSLLLLGVGFFGHELRVPHLRKSAVAFTVVCLAAVVGFVHPLGSTSSHLAFRSVASEPIVRETGLLRFSMRRYLSSLSRIAAAPAPSAGGRWPEAERWREHAPIRSVVLITVDTLRYDHTGYSGLAPEGLTPAMDRLASQAQRFHRAYPQGGWTSLSIPSLMWSRYPKDIEFVPIREDEDYRLYLPSEVPRDAGILQTFQSPLRQPTPSLAEVLAENGWLTTSIPNDGVTHYFHPRLGFSRGFQRIVYPRSVAARRSGATSRVEAVPTDELAVDLAIDAWKALEDERHFLWLHLFDPHLPHRQRPGQAFAGYRGEVHHTDRQLGRFLDALEGSGRLDETLIVLTSDHGEGLGRTRGHGLDLSDGSLRVPLLLRIPGVEPADYDGEVGLIDLAPTILELLDVGVPESFQGRSLYDDDGPHRTVFTETWRYRGATGVRDIHLIGAISDRKKVVYDVRIRGFAFFDLTADPEETRPVVAGDAQHPIWVDWLVKELAQWHEALGSGAGG